jgi:exopolyphosphatase / guanosine-5'-triphosphate,3'-diphosphate pyrophosphatase
VATIDLGTNTVRLLVVEVNGEGRWRTLAGPQRITRLGDGLAASGRLGQEAMARTARTIAEYTAIATAWGVDRVLIVATSAVREAANGRAFATEVEALTGQAVRIVGGDEEARLTLQGVVSGLGSLPGRSLVFDVGGGSTEIIRAREGRLDSAVSLRLGVVDLVADPRRGSELVDAVRTRLARETPAGIWAGVERVVGTAGTVTTLAALDLGLPAYDVERVQGHVLSRAAIEEQRDRLERLPLPDRARLPGLEPGRADVIIPGVAIVLATMELAGAATLTVSEYGLREGILIDALIAGTRPVG